MASPLRVPAASAAALTTAADRYQLPRALLFAIAAKESAFQPNAYRFEPALGTASYGIMQVLETTARALGFRGTTAELFRVDVSAELGARLLRDNLARARAGAPLLGEREHTNRAIAAYNAGWSKEREGDAPRDRSGRFVNQAYVDDVRRLQQLFSPAVPAIAAAVAAVLALAFVAGRRRRRAAA